MKSKTQGLLRLLLTVALALVSFALSGSLALSGLHASSSLGTISAPSIKLRAAPLTPELARILRASNDVIVYFVIQPDGTPSELRLLQSMGYGMDEAGLEAVKHSTFNPGKREGLPVKVMASMQPRFDITVADKAWGAGPMVVDSPKGSQTVQLRKASLPPMDCEGGNEAVVFEFLVDRDGAPHQLETLQGADSEWLPMLRRSISSWVFEPSSQDGQAIDSRVRVVLVKGDTEFRSTAARDFWKTWKDSKTEPAKQR